MPTGIDVNRGVTIQKHPSGMLIYMYCDTPGVYFTAHGKMVVDKVAREAGYDTQVLKKERLKRERMAAAMSSIEAELELADSATVEVVLREKGDYRVVESALGRANILDEEGRKQTPLPIPEAEAFLLLDHLVPDEKKNKK